MFTSAILKKQTSDRCSISLNPYMVFQTWNHGEKREAILLLAYIAPFICVTINLEQIIIVKDLST